MPPLDSLPETELTQVQGTLAEVLWKLEHDSLFFINFFMGESLVFPVPKFHLDIFDAMVSRNVPRLALAIPRGHNKTTLAKLAAVWYTLFSPYRFVVYVSNTAEVAQAAVRDIWGFLNSDNCKAVFGPIEPDDITMKREGEGFYIFNFCQKQCIIRALGSNQQVRGLNVDNARPELGIFDDVEDDENTATDTLQLKLRRWVYGPLFKAFNKWRRKFIWLGNMLSNKCLLKAICESESWHSLLYGCLLDSGHPLWPDLWSLEDLKKDFKEYQEMGMVAKWFAEMMNQPMPEGGGIIKLDEIRYRSVPAEGTLQFVFLTIDPAISKREWADWTAFVVHGYVENAWQVCEAFKAKVDPIQTFHMMLDVCSRWNIHVVGIEAVAYQSALKVFFKHLLIENRLEGFEFVDLMAKGSKTERLLTWTSAIKAGIYFLPQGDIALTNELLNYDPSKPKNMDDLIDAAAYGLQLIANYLYLLQQEYDPRVIEAHAVIGYAAAGV